jgi:hypothetical protein
MFRATMCPSSEEITVSMCGVWPAGSSSLHVSGKHVPIIRRNYCIYATLVFVTLHGWSAGWSETPTSKPDATHTEWQMPVSHRYSNFSWWWAHGCLKHVEKRNEYTKQNCAPRWIYLQERHVLWKGPVRRSQMVTRSLDFRQGAQYLCYHSTITNMETERILEAICSKLNVRTICVNRRYQNNIKAIWAN